MASNGSSSVSVAAAVAEAPKSRLPRTRHSLMEQCCTPYQPKLGPDGVMTPVYTSTVDWEVPLCDSDFLYRRQLADLRPRKQNVRRLAIFDFDNTLFKSPLPNPELWDSRLIGMLKSTDLGWFHDVRTLSPPYLEYTRHHWVRPVVELQRAEARRPDTMVMLLTGRSHAVYREALLRIVELAHGVNFDIVILKETPTRQSPLVSPCISSVSAADDVDAPFTFDYKMRVVEDTITAFPDIEEIKMWDDREGQCEKMQHYLNALVGRSSGRLAAADIYYVPPHTIYMRKANERQLVQSMVSEHNARVCAATEWTDKTQLPVGALSMSTYANYTAVFLSPRSKARLVEAVRSPPGWTTEADRMVIVPCPAENDDIERRTGARLGDQVELVVDSVGTIADAAIAVRVVAVRVGERSQAPQLEFTGHITVAYNEPGGQRSKSACFIKRWRPLRSGTMVLEGTVREHALTTATIVQKAIVKEEVRIGKLVCQHWPDLEGRAIGMAVGKVRQQMADQGVQNLAENHDRIETIVAGLY